MQRNGAIGIAWLAAGLGWMAAVLLWTLWLWRPAPDDYIPKFARVPYEPFSRSATVAIALREWRLFGERVDNVSPGAGAPQDHKESLERREGFWQRVGEYWWIGVGPNFPDRAWTGKHDENGRVFDAALDNRYAWSAAFISYVMRISGAGSRFPYSDAHADFIAAAYRGGRNRGVKAMRPDTYAPQLGDLICFSRDKKVSHFDDIPKGYFHAHCAVVVKLERNDMSVIGGNVGNAVALTHVPTTKDGKIARPDGSPTDSRHAWFVVIAVDYDS